MKHEEEAARYTLHAVSQQPQVLRYELRELEKNITFKIFQFLFYCSRLLACSVHRAAHRSQPSHRDLKLAACSLLLFACSFSFAQQSNSAVQQGNEAYKNGDYKKAIKDYAKALETDGKNTAAWFNKGNALQKATNAEEAAKSYDEAINNAPDDDLRSKAYYNKALAMLQQKNLQAAIDALKQSLRLNAADNDARENLQKAMNEIKKSQQQQPQQNQQQNNSPEQQPQKPKPQKMMNKQMMEQKFQELRNQEKELQKQLQQQKASTQQQEKDW